MNWSALRTGSFSAGSKRSPWRQPGSAGSRLSKSSNREESRHLLVNAQHSEERLGRKSDVSDREWLQELHSVGLLRGSFRPSAEIATLRSYLRHPEVLIQSAVTT